MTGASRGVGLGVTLGLLEAGATVHITARTVQEGSHAVGRAGSLEAAAAQAAAFPGRLVTHLCDHSDDHQTKAAVRAVLQAEGHLDILVNNAWPGYERMVEGEDFSWVRPFWEQSMWRWEAMIDTGLRSAYCTSRIAAAAMAGQGSGLIVNISFWAAQTFEGNVAYGIADAGADKMACDMAYQVRLRGVAAVTLYPGLVRTEEVMKNARFFDLSNSESPQFIGRAVAHLAADPTLGEKSGRVLVAAALAQEYGFTDVDGKQPRPLTLETFSA